MKLPLRLTRSLFALVLLPILTTTPYSPSAIGFSVAMQDGSQPYVTLLPKIPSSSPSPWLVYPTNSTIWVGGIATGTPPRSQISEFFINQSSKPVLTLRNVILSSILADPVKPLTKIWFTENSTLAFFDTTNSQLNETKTITFPGQSIQYLTSDSQHRIWMSVVGSSGTGSITRYDPADGSNQTYPIKGNGTIIQGLTVARDNTIWFAEAGSKSIGHYVPGGAQPLTEFSPPSTVNLAAPIQVAIDASGHIWFTDHGSNQFGVLYPEIYPAADAWRVFPIGYCPDNCLYGLPNSIFVDSKNTIWFSEHIAGRVGHYDPSTSILTEYLVPGSFPLMWWAMPGPNNLVWFVAWGQGRIGYVNASVPIPISITGPSADIIVQRGGSANVALQATSQGSAITSFGIEPATQDQSVQFPAQIYGSPPSNLTLNGSFQSPGFRISAAWNSTLGPRFVALTAITGLVAVNAHVRVVVVDAATPFVAFGFSTVIILGGLTFFIRGLRNPKVKALRKLRR